MSVGLEVDGIGYGPGSYRVYHGADPAVVDRFIADGLDGELRAGLELVPELDERGMTLFRRGAHAAAIYGVRTVDSRRRWWTSGGGGEPWEPDSFGHTGNVPAHAVLPVAVAYEAVREFLATGERPTCVGWREVSAGW